MCREFIKCLGPLGPTHLECSEKMEKIIEILTLKKILVNKKLVIQ